MFLFGASGHAKVVIDIIEQNGSKILGIFDDDPNKKQLWQYPVIGNYSAHKAEHIPCIITVGNNAIRKKIAQKLNTEYCNALHPASVIDKRVKIGRGTVVMASATINADTSIGNHVIINTSSSVDHDCVIHDFVHIAPNATLCGGVAVGEGTLIGAGATVIPLVKIGKWCTIGAGAVIVSDIPDNCKVVGNPGKIIANG
ncbi:acetyltransferase [Fulvivirga sp.]|uniref:acetyltransferase n=1 Tax=Fulvivirga sp. TaxID=1931237 RepID=UPI0032ECBCBE